MGLGQHALTEVLVVLHWWPLPLVQGIFDRYFGIFRDLSDLIQLWFSTVFLWIQFGSKWGVDIGGSLQMDLSYATIPNSEGIMVRLDRELEIKYL